ncbi:MAG: rhodanese-like domain-containing protein [Nitrospirota bacterium]|jgi:adenylyltransferase/sulfurtransferase
MFESDVNIEPALVKEKIDKGEKPVLLDIRNPWEVQVARIEGATHIPMAELQYRLEEIPKDKEVFMVCHTGRRSLTATMFLRQAGMDNVRNLAGGIDAWSREVDPTVPRYR